MYTCPRGGSGFGVGTGLGLSQGTPALPVLRTHHTLLGGGWFHCEVLAPLRVAGPLSKGLQGTCFSLGCRWLHKAQGLRPRASRTEHPLTDLVALTKHF